MITVTLVHEGYVYGSNPLLIANILEVTGTADRAVALAEAENALNPNLSELPHFVHEVISPADSTWRIEIRATARVP